MFPEKLDRDYVAKLMERARAYIDDLPPGRLPSIRQLARDMSLVVVFCAQHVDPDTIEGCLDTLSDGINLDAWALLLFRSVTHPDCPPDVRRAVERVHTALNFIQPRLN